VVAGETEAQAKRHERKPIAQAFFKNRPRAIVMPLDLLPPGVQKVTAREIWDGKLYVLTLRKR
jgi:hypothetical protein